MNRPATTFDLNVVKSGRAAVVQLYGELDLSTAPQLDKQLVILAVEGVLDVTVDVADLHFIDSSGLQALVAGRERFHEQGGDLILRSPRPRTRKVLEITGLTSVFRLEANEAPEPSTPLPDRAPTTYRTQAAYEH